jgi:hypothetical protein
MVRGGRVSGGMPGLGKSNRTERAAALFLCASRTVTEKAREVPGPFETGWMFRAFREVASRPKGTRVLPG